MHVEIQVALNFVISYLYNKLPRRRVNLFGEELERALHRKFNGHWYPDKPFRGSAYRCLRVSTPLDPVLETAARESGLEIRDLRENLPDELSVWIDPDEVSYRIGERGAVKILYSERDFADENSVDCEVTHTFNPEAQCFRPIDAVSSTLGGLALAPPGSSPVPTSPSAVGTPSTPASPGATSPVGAAPSASNGGTGSGGPPSPSGTFQAPSPIASFLSKTVAPPPLTFTTATFAQTKFGSTKLKSSGKRPSRLSPTEFSNYIKQRALLQQQQQQQHVGTTSPQRPRSLSPNPPPPPDPFLLMAAAGQHVPFGGTPGSATTTTTASGPNSGTRGLLDGGYLGDLFGSGPFMGIGVVDTPKSLVDGLNFNLNAMPYPNQHQHLLVAN